jgi:hypothetical protein
MSVRLPGLAGLLALLSGIAYAQDMGRPPPTCTPKNWNDVETWREWTNHTPIDNGANLAEERPRYAHNRDVWRHLDRLFIAVDGGRVVTLTDCPFTDSMYFYLYEGYDENGGFHVVRTAFYEDHVFALMMRKTGRLIEIPGRPVWSPDKARFAYGVCDLLNDKDDVAIMSVADGGLRTEIKGHMPCGLGSCRLIWENNDTLAAVCEEKTEQETKRNVLRLSRRGERWTTTSSR